jgi:hypothetical protein
MRKGGLIGLAAMAIALGKVVSHLKFKLPIQLRLDDSIFAQKYTVN